MKELPRFALNVLFGTRLSRRTALVAQLDRASDYESEGSVFESRRVHHPEEQRKRRRPEFLGGSLTESADLKSGSLILEGDLRLQVRVVTILILLRGFGGSWTCSVSVG